MQRRKKRDVLPEKPFADAAERPKEVAQARPEPFHRVAMDLTDAVTVVVARPLAVASLAVMDGAMGTARARQLIVRGPFVGVDDAVCVRLAHNEPWSVTRVLSLVTRSATAPVSRPITPTTGGRSLANVPWPLNRFARRRGGSAGSRWGIPFSPAFWYISSASVTGSLTPRGGKALEGESLNAVADIKEVMPIDAQLLRERQRRDALRERPKDQDQLRAAIPDALQGRARKRVEHLSAFATAIVDERRAMAVVGRLIDGQGVTGRATQSLRMQHLEQKAVTPILIEQVVDRYQHGVGVEGAHRGTGRQDRLHLEPLMNR